MTLCLPLLMLLNSCKTVKARFKRVDRKVVIGRAVHSDSTEAADALVSLFDVRIINDNDSIFKTYSTNTTETVILFFRAFLTGSICFISMTYPEVNAIFPVLRRCRPHCRLGSGSA